MRQLKITFCVEVDDEITDDNIIMTLGEMLAPDGEVVIALYNITVEEGDGE